MGTLVLWGFGAASFGVIAYLGATGRLPRNRWAGMRTKATMASDESWAAGHRASAPATAVAGVLTLVAGVADAVTSFDYITQRRVTLAVGVVILVIVCIGGIQADRAARAATHRRRSR
ncbi:MAG TPA: SdpI family protein [Acidimicrobiales bacterium]|nr:SdpI family protein [Acidimicrobiales bacterium]